MLPHSDHKPTNVRVAGRLVVVFAAALCATAGCGDDRSARAPSAETGDAATPPAPAIVSSDPGRRPVIVGDVSAVTAWLDLVRRLEAGETVSAEAYQALLETPAYGMIVDENQRNGLNRRGLKWVMEGIFAGADSLTVRAPQSAGLRADYAYLRDRLDEVAAFNLDLCTPALLDEVREDLTAFVPAEDLPERITVRFLAATPLIRFQEPDVFAMDIGLALAAGPEQTRKLLSGRLYIALAPFDGEAPDLGRTGAVKLAGTFRMLRRSAIASWLGDKPGIHFDYHHETLRGQALHPEELRANARSILGRLPLMMANMLAPVNPENLETYGGKIHNMLRFNDRYETTGWAMAELIVSRSGEDGLRSVAGDTVAFLSAYQEAALAEAAAGTKDALPPFPERMFADLIAHLQTH